MHVIVQDRAEQLVVSHAAGDEDAIDIHLKGGDSNTTDFLSYLVSHGAIHFLPFLVAGAHFFLNGEGVVSAEICHETTLAFKHKVDVFFRIFAAEACLHQRS